MKTFQYRNIDIWPFGKKDLINLLKEIFPINDFENFKMKLIIDDCSNQNEIYISSPSVILTNLQDLINAKFLNLKNYKLIPFSQPSNRYEIGIIKSNKDFSIRQVLNNMNSLDTKYQSNKNEEYKILIFRYPWDIFSNIRYFLSKKWEILIEYLKNSWELEEIKEGVYSAKNSLIDDSIIFKGNAIIGANSNIRSGAIIGENVIIFPNSIVEEYCRIAKYSLIGKGSRIGHCAEVSGTLFGNCIIKHYSYFRGVMGIGCNLGAGTMCGTDRFDNGRTKHFRNNKELHFAEGANEIYLGNNSRTGVGALIMSGSILGESSIIGPGVIFSGYLKNRKTIFPERLIKIYRNV